MFIYGLFDFYAGIEIYIFLMKIIITTIIECNVWFVYMFDCTSNLDSCIYIFCLMSKVISWKLIENEDELNQKKMKLFFNLTCYFVVILVVHSLLSNLIDSIHGTTVNLHYRINSCYSLSWWLYRRYILVWFHILFN